jgi:hypothetical protein
MAGSLIKLGDLYFEWSSIVDAPITKGMTEQELHDYVEDEYGAAGLRALPERLALVNATGTSRRGHTLLEVIGRNRAGEDGACLTPAQILERYRDDEA